MTFDMAIARMEGFYAVGSRAQRNNNPGNIEYGEFAKSHGAVGIEKTNAHTKPRFAVFETSTAGFVALRALLVRNYSKLSVKEALAKYAPASENDTATYVKNVCDWLGCEPTDLVGDLL
jgi:hypothetical protein